ncbi:hypothetical protein Pmani_011560 [Petrolisthes manimaculis]|uniref:Regulatory protein zeste n=1 Tax=Petrolisthes manimaculis TaxID=1843537 RepID=A0AAE1Q2Q5_9EUCA|nr:hypothetical protein Pmani_011560 [Petrolisthes manimaculis]
MACEEDFEVKFDPDKFSQGTLSMVDGNKTEDVEEVKLEPEFLYSDEEETSKPLPSLSDEDPIRPTEVAAASNKRPIRKSKKRKFGSNLTDMSDDPDPGHLSEDNSSDDYRLDEEPSNDDESSMSEGSVGDRGMPRNKRRKTHTNNSHKTDGKTGKGASGKEGYEKVSKGVKLSAQQMVQLAQLINEKQAILINKHTGPRQTETAKELKAWQEITTQFNDGYSGQEAQTTVQLKTVWGDIKRRTKATILLMKKSAGKGVQPSNPNLTEDMKIAQSFMTQEENINGKTHPRNQLGSTATKDNENSTIPMTNGMIEVMQKQRKDVQGTLGDLDRRNSELHTIKLKVEKTRMKAEEAKLDAFVKMASFFEKAQEAVNSMSNNVRVESSTSS